MGMIFLTGNFYMMGVKGDVAEERGTEWSGRERGMARAGEEWSGMKAMVRRDGDSVEVRMLWGKWRDTKDRHALLIFAKDYCYFQYEGDTSAAIHYHYLLTGSCESKEAVAKADADNAWLQIYSADSDSPLRTCNEIQNLSKTTLSYMDAKTGALHVYDRVAPAKKK